MKLVVDENIPLALEAFGTLGAVSLIAGSAIDSKAIQEASILVVRSITEIDEKLLQGSSVQFVGTATTGTDHIDLEYLKDNKILFASAAGANATSVAEYVITALLLTALRKNIGLRGKTLGIIGVGHIGVLLTKKAQALGMETILNDPPLKRKTGESHFRSFQETCDADFISLHVPLTNEGRDATHHLFDQSVLLKLHPETVLINTSRGEIVDNKALLQAMAQNKLAKPILDVWETEPELNWALLPQVEIGTSHIAGYALNGKLRATTIIYEAICTSLGTTPSWHPDRDHPVSETQTIEISAEGKSEIEVLSALTLESCNLERDHAQMQRLLNLPEGERPEAFEQIRQHYPMRREFQNICSSIKNAPPGLMQRIVEIGFKLPFLSHLDPV